MPRKLPTIDDVVAALADRPMHEVDLIEVLGLDDESDETWSLTEELLDDPRLVELPDERLALASALLADFVAWHRVSAEEVAARTIAPGLDAVVHLAVAPSPGAVRIGDDVVPLSVWFDDDAPDVDRGPSLPLPEGWAAELAAGDLVGLVLDGEEIHLVTTTDPRARAAVGGSGEVGARLRDALAAVAEEHGLILTLLAEPGEPAADQWVMALAEVAPMLLDEHGPVLRNLGRPLGEVLAETGLVLVDGVVGGPVVSEAQAGIYALGRSLLGSRHDLDLTEPMAVEATGLAWGALVGAGSLDGEAAVYVDVAVLAALELPPAVDAIVDHLRSVDDEVLDVMATRAAQLHEMAPDLPGPAWLAAETLVARCEPQAALEVLSMTIGRGDSRPDGPWRGAWETLANLRAVAGDIGGAVGLFDRMGEVGVVGRLSQWRAEPPAGVGRNERCPCGSGRKFKQCCLIHPVALDLDARVPALWWKLETWVVRYHGDHVPRPDLDVVDADLDRSMLAVWMLGYDAHLVEDGAMAEVVAEVGDLLPADERVLVDQWLLRSRSLWEVVEVDRAGRCRLHDVARGDDVTVTSSLLADEGVGALLLALVVPGAEDEHLVGHAARVPVALRGRVLDVLAEDPDGQAIVELAAALVRPPEMLTPDGDPMVAHEGTWQLTDPDAAVAALDRAVPGARGELRWDGEEGDSIVWSLRMDDDDDLVGTAFSDRRWAAMEALVAEALPEATLLDHRATPGEVVMDAARRWAANPPAPEGAPPGVDEGDDPMDADDAELLARYIRQREVQWCDEQVPALGGITPRQAVADPTRREDVIALLRSFRTPPTPALAGRGFDADRLAALLGLADEL